MMRTSEGETTMENTHMTILGCNLQKLPLLDVLSAILFG